VRFCEKSSIIEAEQFDVTSDTMPFQGRENPCELDGEHWFIRTSQGNVTLKHGDWVIREKDGTFWTENDAMFRFLFDRVDVGSEKAEKLAAAADIVLRWSFGAGFMGPGGLKVIPMILTGALM